MILELTAGALCLATIIAAHRWTIRDLINAADEPDHTVCAAPLCDVVLCYCADDCPDTEPTACAHFTPLCGHCATGECVDCRGDARDSRYERAEGLGDYGRWPA